jgi:hypothetical protein
VGFYFFLPQLLPADLLQQDAFFGWQHPGRLDSAVLSALTLSVE